VLRGIALLITQGKWREQFRDRKHRAATNPMCFPARYLKLLSHIFPTTDFSLISCILRLVFSFAHELVFG